MAEKSLNVVIAGEAGQGLATMGPMLCKSLIRNGYHILVRQDYMSRVRGGHNTFAVRVGPSPVKAPAEQADLLVALNQESVDLHAGELAPGGLIVLDRELDPAGGSALAVPFAEIAPKPLFNNVAALGVVCALLGLSPDTPKELLAQAFAKKGEAVVRSNHDVLDNAYAWVKEQGPDFSSLPPSDGVRGRLMLQSNQAIALGALAAGAKFCSFYPMTPSTSVAMTLLEKGRDQGVVVEQAEDEIAAINMALGASWAGGRAIVPTSGGGFALMVEGISLAGVAEVPIVVALAQRPGPATGLATRTEQADLNMVLSAGHGEFPRAVFAPFSHEDFFHLTYRAMHLAEKHQSPVIVMTDQYSADSLRSVDPFDLSALPKTAQPDMSDGNPDEYLRYAFTESGVSPRRIPGAGRSLSVADSHEHTQDGRMSEDADNRMAMNEKRLDKGMGLFEDAIGPDYVGDEDPELVLVCWGSTMGAAEEAVDMLRNEGLKAGVMHFKQVWPLRADLFMDRLEGADMVVCVEGNATGQFAALLRQETGFCVDGLILKYDGRTFTAGGILESLEELGKEEEE